MCSNRASWILHFGEIPDGLHVLHDCPGGDNKACVNPAHLWLGTHHENILDASRKGLLVNHGWRDPMDVPTRKLDWGIVAEIRAARSNGAKLKEIASQFNISMSCAYAVCTFKTWLAYF